MILYHGSNVEIDCIDLNKSMQTSRTLVQNPYRAEFVFANRSNQSYEQPARY